MYMSRSQIVNERLWNTTDGQVADCHICLQNTTDEHDQIQDCHICLWNTIDVHDHVTDCQCTPLEHHRWSGRRLSHMPVEHHR